MLHTDFIDFSFIIIYSFYCLHDNQYVMHQVPYRPLFRHIWPMWRDLGPAEERAGGKRAGGRKVRVQKSIPSQYATLFSRFSPIFDQLKCFSYHYEPCPTIKHFRKQDIVIIENLATRQMWRDLGPAE